MNEYIKLLLCRIAVGLVLGGIVFGLALAGVLWLIFYLCK